MTLAFSRRTTGRRVGRTCRPTTAANRANPGCTRTILRGNRVVKAEPGANAITFAGRPPGRLLLPGVHIVKTTATDAAAARSTPRSFRLCVRR